MHYMSPKLEGRALPGGGHGVFAREPIAAGELLIVWGGEVMAAQRFASLPEALQRHSLQVDVELYLVPHKELEAADCVNHSCDPNAGLLGTASLVARRAISAGDEVCYDYAMSDSSPYDEFDCVCGSPQCRRRVTGGDWLLPELRRRYAGLFSSYLQRRIDPPG